MLKATKRKLLWSFITVFKTFRCLQNSILADFEFKQNALKVQHFLQKVSL